MVINKKICPAGLKNNPNRKLKSVSFITIHTTGNRSATATAKSHANFQFIGSGGAAKSWHYTADKDEIPPYRLIEPRILQARAGRRDAVNGLYLPIMKPCFKPFLP